MQNMNCILKEAKGYSGSIMSEVSDILQKEDTDIITSSYEIIINKPLDEVKKIIDENCSVKKEIRKALLVFAENGNKTYVRLKYN